MIEVRHLYKSFGAVEVLHDINVKFAKGKVSQIIGKSGSGKSVLAKCIIGLYAPTKGEVLYDGRCFQEMDKEAKRQLRQEIGMLFQSSALFDSLTVLENVMFPLRMFGTMSVREMLERAHFCLKRVKIEGSDKKFPAEISGGMQKRVGIARAISMNPKYLFVDEPNSGLDPQTSIVIDELIEEITKEYNTTTVVITHDMNSVMGIADEIFFINDKQLMWQGTRDELLKSDNAALNEFIFAGSLMREVRKAIS
ncbi:MAG: ATP-binding cassette domain-containing protein [Flavobacteriales bacterium]|jgi:phospholipid/cholesterol/gamma-HCH transport system ATP-binding protein|nr:ATP-binding cassette domain-containing protein [Flavobacteriales bacterium]MBK6892441.1 ATP-binding cassette domain-containing protein [Flavobacteriales bacterium]MBK7246581.1 ATP-binding cassette domain-containing protein [Flavobacteriales bacterium]MBK9597617.1 ATP-binding cassette domain-containing protein [Flavobacteriales bacterium]QQS72257.1 MAG: ATP-binding cassette domain-containing protein [Flavobacteriales bacterium]